MDHSLETQLDKMDDMKLRLQFGQGDEKKTNAALSRLADQRRQLLRDFYEDV